MPQPGQAGSARRRPTSGPFIRWLEQDVRGNVPWRPEEDWMRVDALKRASLLLALFAADWECFRPVQRTVFKISYTFVDSDLAGFDSGSADVVALSWSTYF